MTASEKTPQVQFINVTKTYEKGFKAIDSVSFNIYAGEFVFLIGASGAGKTTLVKLLLREDTPTEGNILLNGEDTAQTLQKEIHKIRRRIGVVFQDFKVLNSKSVFDNVAIALEVADAPKNEIEEIVPNVLALVGLSDKATDKPTTLSGGELQRLSIARAMAREPDILVADEPTGNVDPKSTAHIIEIFEKINALGTTILMATHDDRIVDRLKKRVIKLDKGKVASDTKEGKYHV